MVHLKDRIREQFDLTSGRLHSAPADVVRNLLLEADLRSMLLAFQRESIEVVVLKGIPLALRLFGTIDSRAMVDNDLLVRRRDTKRALDLLCGLGYQPIDGRTLEGQLDVDYQYRLVRRDAHGAGIHAELHWNAFPQTLYPVAEDLLWEHAQPFDWALPRPILVFDEALTLVHLAGHFALSDFAVPSILIDLARAWNLWYARFDPAEAIELAERTGLIHALDFALLSSAELGLLEGEPPAIGSSRARRVRRLLPAGELATERPEHDYERMLAAAMLVEPRRLPKWLWQTVFPPRENLAVIERRSLSPALYLRYCVRPLQLGARVFCALLRSSLPLERR